MGRPMPRTHILPPREIASTPGNMASRQREDLGGLLGTPPRPAPPRPASPRLASPLPVGSPGLVGPPSSSSEITLKPISGKFAFLDGRSLADNAEPVPLSVLAVVAVSQGQGRTLPHSLSGRAPVVWASGGGAAVDWSPGEPSGPFLLARPPAGVADW